MSWFKHASKSKPLAKRRPHRYSQYSEKLMEEAKEKGPKDKKQINKK
jgi:hypothetical protein